MLLHPCPAASHLPLQGPKHDVHKEPTSKQLLHGKLINVSVAHGLCEHRWALWRKLSIGLTSFSAVLFLHDFSCRALICHV